MAERIRILGIDPGSQVTGFGIVDRMASKLTAVKWGSIRTAGDHAMRLKSIYTEVARVVEEYAPDEIAIERVFMHRNADSALKLGQARAAAICATFAAGCEVHEYSARHIKKAVVGQGGAEKTQVQHMIGVLLGIRSRIEPDAADALAAAVCHAHERQAQRVLQAAVSGA